MVWWPEVAQVGLSRARKVAAFLLFPTLVRFFTARFWRPRASTVAKDGLDAEEGLPPSC